MVPTLVARLGQVLFPRAYFCTLYALLCTSFVLTGAENGVAWLPRISDPSAARLLCGQHKLRSVPGRARAREPAKQVIPLSRSDACSAQCAALTKLLDTRSTDRTGTRSTRVTSTKKTWLARSAARALKYFCRSTPLSIRSNDRGQETVSATVSLLSLLAESIGALALDPRNPSSTRASKQALIIQVLSQV
jgi:hypothetical protein